MIHPVTRSAPVNYREMLGRAAFFIVLWGVLTGWKASGWWLGLPAVVIALYVSFHLQASVPLRFQPVAWLRFARFFFVKSFMGGLDVGRRALHPGLPIDPVMLHYELNLSGTTARVFFVNVVGLLPGTLCARINDTHLTIHALDDTPHTRQDLRQLETLIGALFRPAVCGIAGEPTDG